MHMCSLTQQPGSTNACRRVEPTCQCLLQKPAGTLPVRKHKFASTPSTGQAITKFFDKKEEQVLEPKLQQLVYQWCSIACQHSCVAYGVGRLVQARLQQQLAKPRPAGPPPTFSGHSAVSRAQATHAAPAAATVTSAVPTSVSGGQPAVIHITSAAPSHVQPQQESHGESDVPIIRLPAAPHQSSKHVQQQPVSEKGPVDHFAAVNDAPGDVFAVNVSAVGMKPPRQKSTTQPSLEFVSTVHIRLSANVLTSGRLLCLRSAVRHAGLYICHEISGAMSLQMHPSHLNDVDIHLASRDNAYIWFLQMLPQAARKANLPAYSKQSDCR